MKGLESRRLSSVARRLFVRSLLGGAALVIAFVLQQTVRLSAPERPWHRAMSQVAGLAVPARANAEDPGSVLEPDQVAEFMRAKLDHSRAVLEGLAVEDYDLMARAAQDLALASQASSWQVLQTDEYARQSVDFRRACVNLRDAAKAKNLDAAALAWVDVTLKCVQCHRYVRDTR
jgi:hypothetical protein